MMIPDLYIEIFGALTGAVYVILEILKRRSMWIVGILTSLIYIYVFGRFRFYAMMGLNSYYVGISIYGLWRWKAAPHICRISKRTASFCLLAIIVIFLFLYFLLEYFTNAHIPWADALITSMSVVATWMLSCSYLEQWWIWMAVNLLAVAVYGWQGLYPTALLYIAYTAAAVVGYRRWSGIYTD